MPPALEEVIRAALANERSYGHPAVLTTLASAATTSSYESWANANDNGGDVARGILKQFLTFIIALISYSCLF
jgi:hypothetical protein